MTELARREFDDARILQTTQNDARRIFQRVLAAQQNPSRAGIRWPFELIQNAHDAGPRAGSKQVEINFVLNENGLVVSHTGKTFVAQELAALLSGGSSKEFDSEETTGRFGTGFLVTHAVSTDVDVAGVLTTREGSEVFHIELDRDGDEDSIVMNIEQANKCLEEAETVPDAWIATNPTEIFTYRDPDRGVVQRGLDRLEETLPYLYATCSKLGRVNIERLGNTRCYKPRAAETLSVDDYEIRETPVSICTANTTSRVTAVRIGQRDAQSALLAVVRHCEHEELQVSIPREGFARVFVTFPIAGTDDLPFNVVFDGDLATFQERDGIAMNDADKASIGSALSALPHLLQHAITSQWRDAHELARMAAPPRAMSGEVDSGEMQWWDETVRQVATRAASTSLVQTDAGYLPALLDLREQFVSFPIAAIDADASDCIDYEAFYKLARHVTGINLPSRKVAESWGAIASQWHKSGVKVNRLGLKELTDWIKRRANSVSDLPIEDDPYTWLAQLCLLAAATQDQNARLMIRGLLPNQHGLLNPARTGYLYGDAGIPSVVKDIASALGEDLRSQLLHDAMAQALTAPGYDKADTLVQTMLDKSDGGYYTESKAIDLIIDRLETALPNNNQFDNDRGFSSLVASASMIVHLAKHKDTQRLRRCPLLTAAGQLAQLSGSQQILAPVNRWPESARPYANLYPENRLLSNHYGDSDELDSALDSLINIGLVVPAPLFEGRRAELTDVNLLREMSPAEEKTLGITVRDATFGQIAFLATDLFQRCGENVELAKLLLDFVLNVAAREDQSWRQVTTFSGTRSGERVSLSLAKAVWPFELKVRSWIPVRNPESDAIAPMPANESNLREILDLSWLKGNPNAVKLLHYVFGFRQLTLLLDSLGDEIEGDLVKLLQFPELVKAAARNPEAVRFASDLQDSGIALGSVRDFIRDASEDDSLLEHLENRREQRRRVHGNQNLGATIENLVSDQLTEVGFNVRRTGVGSDFEISLAMGHLADLHISREGQSWLVEVKATRDQRVRMTATQARTAVREGERFLLCVVPVDSNNVSEELSNMRFVSGLGGRLTDLCDDLGLFEDMRDEITADTEADVQLDITPGPARVRVLSSVWESEGFPLHELAARLLPS